MENFHSPEQFADVAGVKLPNLYNKPGLNEIDSPDCSNELVKYVI